jgi:3-hydroxyacyl-[acyl-carrier-protein] dehydratase
MKYLDIVQKLPYTKPFLFVDSISQIDENGVTGKFTFHEDFDFYRGHFVNNPVTPGVILVETMAQIGLVCLGIFLSKTDDFSKKIAITSAEIEFLKPVFPNETVVVVSQKIYFRFGKLKCHVKMFNENNLEVCSGTLAGMIVS